uniref:Potassium transporter n=1 Tax=Oryza glumipatula TaxID=40148 RepID=A0A0E0AWE5_9ORYZ
MSSSHTVTVSMDVEAGQKNKDKKGISQDLILAYKTLGVVFGGLVTSPLYVYPSMNLTNPTEEDYLGIYSIMFWTLTLIGVVKYICIALNADDHGEGGTFAMYSLLCQHANIGILPSKKIYTEEENLISNQPVVAGRPGRLRRFIESSIIARRLLLLTAILGMCMLIGDGILTPAISVLSAIDGLRGPFPSVSKRAEAMFADLGHFSKRSIQIAFMSSIYPSLVLTYAGQTAYLINNVDDFSDGFYKFVPRPVYWPMFIIATLAAIVASQSLISATFSVIKQSVVLDYFPRVKVVHTSKDKEGEVYSPETNYMLMLLCVGVILGFGDGKDIGNAFGVVVILVMLITTILLTLVMLIIWGTHVVLVALYLVPFLLLEATYVSAVCTKILRGGWVPFAVSVALAAVMFGWYYGRQRKTEYEAANKVTLERLGELLSGPGVRRVPGLCFFYSNRQDGGWLTPVLAHYIRNMRSLHEVTVFLTLRYLLVAKVDGKDRVQAVRRLGPAGVYGCTIQYGYADAIDFEEDDIAGQVVGALRERVVDGEEEGERVEAARAAGVVHVRGKMRFHVGKDTRLFDRVLLGFYELLHGACRSALPALGIPLQQRVEIGMLYKA